jgi:hypothetical protein
MDLDLWTIKIGGVGNLKQYMSLKGMIIALYSMVKTDLTKVHFHFRT